MRKNVRVLALVVMVVMLLAVAVQAAPKVGDIVNYTLYTDIALYIDGKPVKSFNIDGYTAVRVEDLVYYGFDVVWNQAARTVKATRGTAGTSTEAGPGAYIAPKNMIGKRAERVYYTDIRCFLDYKEVQSYNIGGETIIFVDDLAAIYAETTKWNPDTRELVLNLVKPWKAEVVNMRYNLKSEILNYGFAVTTQNETVVKITGDFAVVPKLVFTERSASFVLNANVSSYGQFFDEIVSGINIDNGVRIAEDTPARREALGKVLRLFIDGNYVSCELAYSYADGLEIYTLVFDKYIPNIGEKQVRIEVGPEE